MNGGLPYARAISEGIEELAARQMQMLGKGLPCSVVSVSGAIVTVKFEVRGWAQLPTVTMPLAGAEYIRYPIKAGDKGVCLSADTTIGNVSGLGAASPAELRMTGNLTGLVFFPIGNKTWSAVDPNALTLYAPNGVVVRNTGDNSRMVLTPNGVVVSGNDTITLNSGGCVIGVSATTGKVTIHGSSEVEISSAAHSTSLAQMASAFKAFVDVYNSHGHPTLGGAPNALYTGQNIVG